jgi:hypothetical protein
MLARLADEEYVVRLDGPRRRYALRMRLVAVAGQSRRSLGACRRGGTRGPGPLG